MSSLPYVKALEAITNRCRTDITALKKDGKMIWTKQSLTPARMVAHLEGRGARGLCPIKAGERTCKVAVLDLDSHKGETPQSAMFKAASDIADRLFIDGVYAIAFRSSGGNGIHLYMLWNDEQDAYSIRKYLGGVLGELGLRNGAGGVAQGQVEIFPKQDYVPEDGNGSQFILPLAGKSVPLDLVVGLELDNDAVLDDAFWPISHGVPVIPRTLPVRTERAPVEMSAELAKLTGYVMALDPDLEYDSWLKVGMALHQATAGSDEGFAVWDDWSSEGTKYPSTEALRAKWDSFDDGRDGGVTANTLEMMARGVHYNADILDDFEVIEEHAIEPVKEKGTLQAATGEARKALPKFTYTKHGEIECTIGNVKKAIERPDLCGWEIKLDCFRDEIMRHDGKKWAQFTDADYTRLRLRLEKNGFKPVGRELMRDVVGEVADTNRFDSAIEWLNAIDPWDGVPRIDTFLCNYMGAENNEYVRAVGAYMWTALAGRVLEPGCQVDMVPILEGKQGVRKTSAVKAIVPHKELFCNVSFTEKDDDLARKMRGRLIAEIGELKGLHSRDLETIKEFIVRTDENWIPKFKEFGTTFPRRLIFIGTTNQAEFLADETGNRRWLPVHVEWCDVDRIKADRNQLWAEARERFKVAGIAYQDAERLAENVHEKYMMHDAWEEIFGAWLHAADLDGKSPASNEFLLISDILRDAYHFDTKQIKRGDELRIGKILRKAGYERAVRRVNGKPAKVWVPSVTLLV